jgi:UDP-glucose 4-epimerase
MRILVTGCAGFIGSHLTERLLSDGHEVTGVDALTASYDPEWKLRNVELLCASSHFEFVHSEVLKMERRFIEDAELIFHLAARPGVRTSWGSEFQHYLRHNVLSTQRLLEWAARSRQPKRIVFASSSSVYGDTTVEQVSEDHPANPVSPYGITKLSGEHLCAAYSKQSDFDVITLRLFTVYGPRQRPDMAFHRLIRAAFMGTKFILYGDGEQLRDFTFVQDAVQAFTLAANCPVRTDTFNVSGGARVTMNQAIELVEEVTGSTIDVERVPPQSGDVRNTGADLSKSREILGYRPSVTLREGLRAQIESMRGHRALAATGD